ncbi:MAG TPA: SAM-dependent methyltransferase [Candidatus Acidoferrum sp.]|nr:SAM-dependent methyltransferase [Candidatus Acidoferrum sp.]
MQAGKPSRTALGAAAHRAAHQILEGGRIFADPLALRILGQDTETVLREAEEHPFKRIMRLFIAVRTRFAEDALAAAVDRGVRQLVVLGAGLDTYAYRCPFGDRLRIFEVDYPATQAWKREQLAAADISPPDFLRFAPIDFERQTLADGLANAGFDPAQQTFFTWLGVVPYLTEEAIGSTLAFVSGLPGGAHVVFDYSDPPEALSPEMRNIHDKYAERVGSVGEAWVSHFEPVKLHAELATMGFCEIEDLGPPQIAARYFPGRISAPRDRGGHIIYAATKQASG